MSFPSSSNPQDSSHANSPTSAPKNARSQQSVWGVSNGQQGPRRGLTPISTAASSSQARSGTSSPSRNTFSPVQSSSFALPHVSKQVTSRHSSVSSSSSLFSPLASSSQQPSTARSRGTTSSGSPHLASSAAGSSAAQGTGAGITSGGGGTSRFVRGSPSLSFSSGSPVLGGSQSAGSSGQLTSLVVTQLNILLSTIREDKDRNKWEAQAEKIRKLVDAHGMEVFSQYFRRLLQSNASQIFPGTASGGRGGDGASGSYQLLVSEMQKLTVDPDQAPKIAESLDTTEGDLFKDFNLSVFMDHFRLSPIARTALAVSCKVVTKPDLRAKADAILSNNFDSLHAALTNPTNHEDIPPTYLASLLDRLFRNTPSTWTDERKTELTYAVRLRYNRLSTTVPYAVSAAIFLVDLLGATNTLVRLVQRTGPNGAQTVESCKEMLYNAETSSISYAQVANALLYMVITENGEKYNAANFVSALRQHRAGQRLDWQDVLTAFDRAELRVTKQQFLALYNALLPLSKDYENFDIQGLWGNTWQNPDTQLSFVVAFLQTSPAELDVSQIPRLRTAFTLAEFDGASDEIKEYAAKAVTHPMVSLDATDALFTIIFSSQEAYNHAQSLGIPEAVINANTDVFVCAASATAKPWAPLQEQALKQLFNPFFSKALPNYGFVMHALWQHDKHWLAGKLIENYNQNPKFLHLVFDHAREHNWVDDLVQVKNDFGLDFTALAHAEEMVDLEQWVQGHQSTQVPPQELSRAIISFLRFKIEDETSVQREHNPPATVPLRIKTVYALLSIIQDSTPEQEMNTIQRECIGMYPRLINYGYRSEIDEVIDKNSENGNGLSNIAGSKMEDEYKDMYGGGADARKIVGTLRSLKDSTEPGDQELFACMIHGLFDEYNCFGEYPLEALATTAVLFGGIINYHLLESGITLGVAIFMVVDAVSEFGPDDSMFKFGLQALIHFKDRLELWPTLCERLLRIHALRGTEVYAKAQEVLSKKAPEDVNGKGDDQVALTNGNGEDFAADSMYQRFTSVNADPPWRSDIYEEPDEDTSDKVMFVLNNVSKRNLEEKFKDLDGALEERHHQWFASYLVEDLAKTQPNFQSLYLQLLGLFDRKILWAEVLRETYVSISRIINAESTLTSTTDRSSLKNLAGFLGLLTIARNRPILHRNISFKDLLIEAHQSQRLIIAIPFTCKVLAQVANSNVFKPPNPWTMELIGFLIELYNFAELKLNLKFEIEVLCKELDLDHTTLEPGNIIRSLPLATEESFLQPYAGDSIDGFGEMPLVGLSKRASTERFSSQEVIKSLPDLGALLHYPPSPGNASQQQLKNIFLNAAQRAIQEIIAPVVERSVTIAAISTSQLVEKDFSMDPDPERLRASAHNVVKALAGSLALVTCKEPLRMSITNNIRLLAAQQLPEQLPEGSILMFVNDNLDTVCKMIETSAEGHSEGEIDAQIEEGMEKRRRHRQQRPNEPFNDPPTSRWAFYIPEPYRQESKGLNPAQLAIYDDFGRHVRIPSANHANNASVDTHRQLPDVLSENYLPNLPTPAEAPALPRQAGQQQRMQAQPSLQPQQSHPQMNGYMDLPSIMDRMQELLTELQSVAREAPEEHIRDLSPTAPTREVYEQLLHIIDVPVQKDQIAMAAGQRATLMVYTEAKSRLEIEVLVQFLNQLCAISASTARQLVTYLADLDDDRVFNAAVTVCLLRTMLIDLHHVDMQVAKALQTRRATALQFLEALVDELVLSDQSAALRVDFAMSFDALTRMLADEPNNDRAREVMNKLSGPSALGRGLPSPPEAGKQDQFEYIFDEWVAMQRPDIPERTVAAFIHQLEARQILASADDVSLFIRVCIESSIDAYEHQETLPFGSIDHAYLSVDALAKLISCLMIYKTGENGGKDRYLESILIVAILIFNHHHESRRDRFNSKVFFRLFSSLFCEVHASRMHFADDYESILVVLGNAMLALQPQLFPGFAFAWLGLVSHRMFVMPVMQHANGKAAEVYVKLLCTMLQFLGDMATASEHAPWTADYYRGSLRLLSLLQNDYPDFLAENHLYLDSNVPSTMVQLNNIINFSHPRSLQDLPDPFTPGLKINRLDQMRQTPKINGDVERMLVDADIRAQLDNILSSKEVKAEDVETINRALDTPVRASATSAPAMNTLLVNALILYIGNSATVASSVFSAAAPQARLLERMLVNAQPDLRHHILSAVVNQLRYPNSHTHYFSTAILHLFGTGSEDVQEQLVRVLVERLMVARPHPWGVIVTILELIKNPDHNIWESRCVKAAPEIERMLLNVAHSQSLLQSPGR